MKRILYIGNSHLAARKLGWERIADDYTSVGIEFFGAPNAKFRMLRFEGSRFGHFDGRTRLLELLERVNGRTEIDTAPYDAVVCVGDGREAMRRFSRLFAHCDMHDIVARGRSTLLSASALRAVLASIADTVLEEARWIRPGRQRVHLCTRPLPTQDIVEKYPNNRNWRDVAEEGAAFSRFHALYQDILAEALARAGFGLLRQPASTLGPRGLTKEAFGRGSERLGEGDAHESDDVMHMNAEYGAAAMRAHLDRLLDEPLASVAYSDQLCTYDLNPERRGAHVSAFL